MSKKRPMTPYDKGELIYHIFATIVIVVFIIGMIMVAFDT